jgi:glucose/arabinose dehydrogenase
MSVNGQRQEPPDLRFYEENRRKFPQEELAKYWGKHVAFSPDGTRILASGDSINEVDDQLTAAGIPISQVVHAFIDPPDLVLL